MSEPSSSLRASRGRVLLVGASGTAMPEFDPPALMAANLFEAIGEITHADATSPIDRVVISSADLTESAPAAIDALRCADPSIRVFLLVREDCPRETLEYASACCDGVLREPWTDEDVHHLLDDSGPTTTSMASPPTLAEDSEPARSVIEPDEKTFAQPPDMGHPIIPDAPVDASAGSEPDDPSGVNESELLGDTDLAQAAMTDPEGLLQTALSLIRQETGWVELFHIPGNDGPEHIESIGLVAEGESLGRLLVPGVPHDEIQPWAEWLATWLLLDRRYRDYRRLAFQDDLTSAWNRRYCYRFLDDVIRRASLVRRPVTVMVFDIDNFKQYNDRFGHEAGDIILIETVRLLQSEIRPCDRVCRIGGDEFAVIFADLDGPREVGSAHPERVETIARRFQMQICEMKFPKLGLDAPGALSISGGLASFPWDGKEPAALLRHADQLSLHSKRKGKNVLTFGPGIQSVCPPQREFPPDTPD